MSKGGFRLFPVGLGLSSQPLHFQQLDCGAHTGFPPVQTAAAAQFTECELHLDVFTWLSKGAPGVLTLELQVVAPQPIYQDKMV